MSDILDTIRQGADDLLSGLDQKGQIRSALEGLRSQWSDMDRRRKISSLEKQIQTQRAEMKQLTEALGLQALSLYETGSITNPELGRLCERITELRSEVATQKAQVEQMKAEAKAQAEAMAAARAQARAAQAATACPQCGAAVPAGDRFCHKCGAEQQAPPPTPAAAPPPAGPRADPAAAVPPAPSGQPQQGTVIRLRCPQCKTILPSDAEFCSSCGVKFKRPAQAAAQPAPTSATRFCPACGAETKPGARFCPICGQTMA
jgi:RNA polymerase subunit RPABC4/transcription elongation factor Spt4